MKRVKFIEQSIAGTRPKILVGLLIMSGIFPVLALFDVFDGYLAERTVKLITAACYLIIAIYSAQGFFYRNSVQYTKRGATIRINNFWGVSVSFSDVKSIDYSEDEFIIHKYGGSTKVLDLKGIEQESKNRLLQILQQRAA